MTYSPLKALRMACASLCFVLTCLLANVYSQSKPAVASTLMQQPQPVITLDAPTGWDLQEHAFDAFGKALPEAPANFRRLGTAKAGEVAPVHTLTLRFAETLTLTQIKSTPDFKIEPGGSCAEGAQYEAKSTCTLLVRFTPQGPGNRLGHVVVTHSDSSSTAATTSFGLGGFGSEPVISFIPALIATLPGTFPSSVGLLSGAKNLWIDGNDTLWVSDTGNNVVRNLDSSGVFKTLASGFTAPWGITVDNFGEAYFSRPAANTINEIFDYGPVVQVNGAGTGPCPAATPCTFNSHAVTNPGELSIDQFNHMFFTEQTSGGAFSTVQPIPANLFFLYDPFPFQTNPTSAAAIDSGDNIYSLWANGGTCSIIQQSLFNAENTNVIFNKIAGGHTCGFSGDGGLAGNAEINNSVGQFFFDTAGDMYFSDTANQRVRRIDFNSGVIRTVAGNGIAGYTGDGGRATGAELNNPTGVAVDSQGSVYIISSATTGQVIRKVGPQGYLAFGFQFKGLASAPSFVTVTNTGNNTMNLTNVVITGTNAADFKIDPTTTTCGLTSSSALFSGQTCRIGMIVTPAATGTRTAALTLLDNTVNGADTVTITATGVLRTPTFQITSPANGASFKSGTAVTFSASVTSSSNPQPTGTVQFIVDGVNHGSPVALSSGTASTSLTGLSTAAHTLSATYSGDANFAAAGPIKVSINVTAMIVQPAVALSAVATGGASACSLGRRFAVTVSSASGLVPTGHVQLLDRGKSLASGSLVAGKVLLSAHLRPGRHKLTASYAGDAFHFPAVSSALVERGSSIAQCGAAKAEHSVLTRMRF